MSTTQVIDRSKRYSIREVCELLGKTRRTIDRYIQKGYLDKKHYKETGGAFIEGKNLIRFYNSVLEIPQPTRSRAGN